MKTQTLFLLIFLFGTLLASAQETTKKYHNQNPGEPVKISQCVVRNDLQIICDQAVDFVTFSDRNGRIVYQASPVDNKISIQSLDTGFYLLDAYVKGVKVKRGIVKKI